MRTHNVQHISQLLVPSQGNHKHQLRAAQVHSELNSQKLLKWHSKWETNELDQGSKRQLTKDKLHIAFFAFQKKVEVLSCLQPILKKGTMALHQPPDYFVFNITTQKS